MLVFKIIGKILSIPLIILTAVAAFIANLITNLSGIVLVPLLVIVAGYDIYFLIMTRWLDVCITTVIGVGLFLVLFAASFVIAVLEEARNGLIRFLHS